MKSGELFRLISRQFAILKEHIRQNPKFGLTDLNKESETFFMKLLNLIYGYKLEFAARKNIFPGIDVGEDGRIGLQITSRNDAKKVNDTLEKVINHELYKTYPRIKILMINKKLTNYNIAVATKPHFDFDWKEDIVDLDDLLQEIQGKDSEQLQTISDFVNSELDYLSLEEKNTKPVSGTDDALIDVEHSMKECGLSYYQHFTAIIDLKGKSFNPVLIYRELMPFWDRPIRYWLPILFTVYKQKISAKEVIYKRVLSDAGATNHFKEIILRITDSKIQYEFAQYKSNPDLLTDMSEDFRPVLILLLFTELLYADSNVQLEIDINLATNGTVMFMPVGDNIFSVERSISNYCFEDDRYSFKKSINNLENETLMALMQQVVDCFSGGEDARIPFLTIDQPDQELALNHIKKHVYKK